MNRKLIATACMAVAAFAALAIGPAIASATNDPLLTHPAGTAIKVGTKVEWTSLGATDHRHKRECPVRLQHRYIDRRSRQKLSRDGRRRNHDI